MGRLNTAAITSLILFVLGGCEAPSGQAAAPRSDAGVGGVGVPAQRGGAPAAWMPSTREMLIFGGMDPITNDTFSFSQEGAVWRQLAPEQQGPVPAQRCHHTLTEVPGADQAILFGGFSRSGRFNDTWRFDFDAQAWTELATSGATPARRCLHASAFLESRDELLMFGGIAGGGNRATDFFADTHVLEVDTGVWTRVDGEGPSAREGPVMFYSDAIDAAFLWGGKAFDHYPTELWRFDVDARTWSQIATSGEQPRGREDPTYFWNESRGRLTIFSGRNDRDEAFLLEDGYELDIGTQTWLRIDASTAPSPRWRASVAVDPERDRGLMFGGWRDFGGTEAFNDTWRYELETRSWVEIPSN